MLSPASAPPAHLPCRRCGFGEVPRAEAPACLQVEYLAGLVVAWLVARDRLVLMRCAPAGGARPSVASGTTGSYDSEGDVFIDTSQPLSPWWWQPDRREQPPESSEGGEEPHESAEGGEEPPESPESGDASSAGESGSASSAGWQWPDLGGVDWGLGGSSGGGDGGGDSGSGSYSDSYGGSGGGGFGGGSFGGDSFGGGSFGGGSFDSGSFDNGGGDCGGE